MYRCIPLHCPNSRRAEQVEAHKRTRRFWMVCRYSEVGPKRASRTFGLGPHSVGSRFPQEDFWPASFRVPPQAYLPFSPSSGHNAERLLICKGVLLPSRLPNDSRCSPAQERLTKPSPAPRKKNEIYFRPSTK